MPLILFALSPGARAGTPVKRAILATGCRDAPGDPKDRYNREAGFMKDALGKLGWDTGKPLTGDGFNAGSLSAALNADAYHPGPDGQLQGELFLNIRTHGTDAGDHQICVGENPRTWIDISNLKTQLTELARRGLKVTVVDNSCFGGMTVKQLAGSGVCAISSTYANLEGSGVSVGARMVAHASAWKANRGGLDLNALTRAHPELPLDATLLKRHSGGNLGEAATFSAEEAFLDARTFSQMRDQKIHVPGGDTLVDDSDNYARTPAQISSDTGAVGDRFKGLYAINLTGGDLGNLKSDVAATAAAGACDPGNPLLEKFTDVANATVDAVQRPRYEEVARALGFKDLADARQQAAALLASRQSLGAAWKAANDHFNQVKRDRYAGRASEDDFQAAIRDRDQAASAFQNSSGTNFLGQKLERLSYYMAYLRQRATSAAGASNEDAKPCADFTF